MSIAKKMTPEEVQVMVKEKLEAADYPFKTVVDGKSAEDIFCDKTTPKGHTFDDMILLVSASIWNMHYLACD